jgi:hypothetical protein
VNGGLVVDFASVSGFLFLLSTMAVLVAIHLLHREWERNGSGGTRAFFAAFVGVALILGGSFLSKFIPDKAGIGHLLFLIGELLFLVGALVATVGIIRLAVVTLTVGVLPRWGGAYSRKSPRGSQRLHLLSHVLSRRPFYLVLACGIALDCGGLGCVPGGGPTDRATVKGTLRAWRGRKRESITASNGA